jgi:hypothetical protein
MPMPSAPRGVRKASELITQQGRSVIITEEDDSKLDWSQIPDGTIKVNPTTGLMSVKLKGQSAWVPAGIKNDGTLCIAKDSMIKYELFTIKTTSNGDGTFTYINKSGEQRTQPITQEGYFVFELEEGSYMKRRNHLDITIDDVLHRNVQTGGVVEIDEHLFAIVEKLEEGMEITAKYIQVLRIGNPYPRMFIDEKQPSKSEIGDFWLDLDGAIGDNDLGENIEGVSKKIPWSSIIGKPSTVSGYEITDDISYVGHKHKQEDIHFTDGIKASGGNANTVNNMSPGTGPNKLLITDGSGKIPENVIPLHIHKLLEIEGLFDALQQIIPKGIICIWSGSVASIPAGWVLCDGSNGTPDIRGKFVLGSSSKFDIGQTGGEESHALTIEEMPKHSHTVLPQRSWGQHSSGVAFDSGGATGTEIEHKSSFSGNDKSHNNMPPYYALCYIMKISNSSTLIPKDQIDISKYIQRNDADSIIAEAIRKIVPTYLTDMLKDDGHSFGENGWQKLSNGFMIQWGVVPATPVKAYGIENLFTISFPRACFYVSSELFACTEINPRAPYKWTKTGFEFYGQTLNWNNKPIVWFAIGC